MAYFNIKYYSNALHRTTSFEMILPNDVRADLPPVENEYQKRPTKTLFLLHGYTGSAGSWLPDYLAGVYNFAIVMPNGENGFWVDGISSGHAYATMIAEEIPDYLNKTFGLCRVLPWGNYTHCPAKEQGFLSFFIHCFEITVFQFHFSA